MSKEEMRVRHPATFPQKIIEEIECILYKHLDDPDIPGLMLDPFAGTGKITDVEGGWVFVGIEIESEWADQAADRGVTAYVGDSRHLPFPERLFNVICTSPAYGNRLADDYAPDMTDPKNRMRRSYRIALGRPLSPGNGGALHWGDEYRELHEQVWKECVRVLLGGGLFILNIKDHYRKGVLQRVPEWHRDVLRGLGLELVDEVRIPLSGDQNTNTMRSRGVQVEDYEILYVFRKPTSLRQDQDRDPVRSYIG